METISNHTLTETDLIAGCISNDGQMQRLLYDRYAPKMFGVCLRYSGNSEEANDILQDGFVRVFLNLPKFRGEGSFEGWVRRIFVNTSIEYYRKKVKSFNITEVHENTVENEDLSALNLLDIKDLMNIISKLSPGYKTIFNLYVVEGYSHKEIGEMLGISEGTSKSQLARAKGALKKLLEVNFRSMRY